MAAESVEPIVCLQCCPDMQSLDPAPQPAAPASISAIGVSGSHPPDSSQGDSTGLIAVQHTAPSVVLTPRTTAPAATAVAVSTPDLVLHRSNKLDDVWVSNSSVGAAAASSVSHAVPGVSAALTHVFAGRPARPEDSPMRPLESVVHSLLPPGEAVGRSDEASRAGLPVPGQTGTSALDITVFSSPPYRGRAAVTAAPAESTSAQSQLDDSQQFLSQEMPHAATSGTVRALGAQVTAMAMSSAALDSVPFSPFSPDGGSIAHATGIGTLLMASASSLIGAGNGAATGSTPLAHGPRAGTPVTPLIGLPQAGTATGTIAVTPNVFTPNSLTTPVAGSPASVIAEGRAMSGAAAQSSSQSAWTIAVPGRPQVAARYPMPRHTRLPGFSRSSLSNTTTAASGVSALASGGAHAAVPGRMTSGVHRGTSTADADTRAGHTSHSTNLMASIGALASLSANAGARSASPVFEYGDNNVDESTPHRLNTAGSLSTPDSSNHAMGQRLNVGRPAPLTGGGLDTAPSASRGRVAMSTSSQHRAATIVPVSTTRNVLTSRPSLLSPSPAPASRSLTASSSVSRPSRAAASSAHLTPNVSTAAPEVSTGAPPRPSRRRALVLDPLPTQAQSMSSGASTHASLDGVAQSR